MTSFPTLPPCVCHGHCDVHDTVNYHVLYELTEKQTLKRGCSCPISDPSRFVSESPRRLSFLRWTDPHNLCDREGKQSESTNRCHTGNNRVLVVGMDMTTVHPIIKFLQWEGETGTSAMRSLAMRWRGGGRSIWEFQLTVSIFPVHVCQVSWMFCMPVS